MGPHMLAAPDSLLKISLDELRMQMLGTQVAFGFQLESLFQERFAVGRRPAAHGRAERHDRDHPDARPADRCSGDPSNRRWRSGYPTHARSDFQPGAVGARHLGDGSCVRGTRNGRYAIWAARRDRCRIGRGQCKCARLAMLGHFSASDTQQSTRSKAMQEQHASVHERIDYLLTESRVMLPGAQALLGFQLLVPRRKPSRL